MHICTNTELVGLLGAS